MRIHFQSALIVTSLCVCVNVLAQDQQTQEKSTPAPQAESQKIDDAKRVDIKKMLELTGAGKIGVQAVQQMIGMQRQQNPIVPQEFWDEFLAEVNPNDLIDLSIPSYDKHFTHDEIKELIKFYDSPIGKKMIEVQPQIVEESMVAGQKWGMDLARRISERLEAEGF